MTCVWILAILLFGFAVFFLTLINRIKLHYQNMCTNPKQRTISYKGNFSKKTVTVPCGKCAECRAKLQSEFAALSCLEAEDTGCIGFLTLTYDNDNLPLLQVRLTPQNEVYMEKFSRGYTLAFSEVCKPIFSGVRDNCDEVFLTPSLRREDVQLAVKRYRQDYFRRHGERCDFRFTFFGEYGERFYRPHYHMLVYGLDRVELDYFCKQWKFGFIDCKFIEHFNADGSDAFSKVSRYVSKYVGKQDALPDFVRLGYAEKPRKQSSIRLGQRGLDVDRLRSFT